MRLVEEAVDDTLAEIAVLVVIHFQDLLESALIDELLDIGELGRSALGLGTWSASDGAALRYRCYIPLRPSSSQSEPCWGCGE
jgi:hypothetical protein